jgi:hypothetical protein
MEPRILAVIVAQASITLALLKTLVDAGLVTREQFYERLTEERDTLPELPDVADVYDAFMELLAPCPSD